MFLRAIKNPHRSQQRLGFLKYLTYKASQNDSSTVKGLGTELLRPITKKINVEINNVERNEYLKSYIEQRLRKQFKDISKGQQKKIYLELQDLYLAASEIPSKTGKLSFDDCQKKYPYFLSSIGFAREKSYSLLVRGKVLMEFVPKDELDAFINYSKTLNPFLLNQYQKYIFLYSILENDGDVIRPLYSKLLTLENSFSDWTAGNFLPDIYIDIAKFYRPSVSSGVDKERLNQLFDSAKNIKHWVNNPRTGGKNAKLNAITPRLEPFVDVGLLKKPDPYKYEYYFSPEGRDFFSRFCAHNDIARFLDESFFLTLNKSFKLKASPANEDEIMEILFLAFGKLKSPLGYAPTKEIALLGGIRSVVDKNKYFEIGQATKLVTEYQKAHPYKARFQVDRSGAPVYVKFLNEKENKF